MSLKKKQVLCSPRSNQTGSKIGSENRYSVRKSYQKHSKKGTKDYKPIKLQNFLNLKYYNSARQTSDRTLSFSINNVILGKIEITKATVVLLHLISDRQCPSPSTSNTSTHTIFSVNTEIKRFVIKSYSNKD